MRSSPKRGGGGRSVGIWAMRGIWRLFQGGLRLSSNRDGPVVQEGALERLLFIDLVGRRL